MRRRGVGRELVGAFLEIAGTEGHEKVWLITRAGYWWNLA